VIIVFEPNGHGYSMADAEYAASAMS